MPPICDEKSAESRLTITTSSYFVRFQKPSPVAVVVPVHRVFGAEPREPVVVVHPDECVRVHQVDVAEVSADGSHGFLPGASRSGPASRPGT